MGVHSEQVSSTKFFLQLIGIFISSHCYGSKAAYVFAIVLSHRFNQVDSTDDIVCVVEHWLFDTFSDSLSPSKMYDSIKSAREGNINVEEYWCAAEIF